MTVPGPDRLGRGVVVRPGAGIPKPWASAPVVEVYSAEPAAAGEVADRLHELWVSRTPVVVRWGIPDDALASEHTDRAPWELDESFLFPGERLRFLCFSNNYDARDGEPRWWWAHKAEARGAGSGGPADVIVDGTPVWIDGGPREPLEIEGAILVHGETIEAGLTDPVRNVEPVSSGLASDQAEAVNHQAGAARIIAPAGSGKTRTLAARLRHLLDDRGVEPGHVVAVAYNARAAAELRDRVRAGRDVVRTIHSLGWAILGEARPGVELIDEREVRTMLTRMVSIPRRANTDVLGPYLEALDRVRSGLVDPALVEVERDDVPGFGDLFERYRTRLYRAGRVDHGEQVYGAIEALLRDPALRARWQARCRHVLVDEFQDLTPAYLLLIRLVASPQLQVFGVGDDDQVIYGYAGADPRYLIEFDSLFPGAAHHALEVNYRCPPEIVDGARTLLGYNRNRIDKVIRAHRPDPSPSALEVRRAPGPDLARQAAGQITRWIEEDGVEPSAIAVLARVNSSLIPVKAALAEAGIPTHDLLSPESLRRTALRALWAWIRIARNPDRISRADALEAVRRPSRGLNTVAREIGISRTTSIDELRTLGLSLEGKQAARWDGFCADLRVAAKAAKSGDATRLVQVIANEIGLAKSARTLDAGRGNASRSGHLDDLVAVERASVIHPDLDGFTTWLETAVATPSTVDGVTLSSVHRVKGMEWDRVVVLGVDRGAWPHDLATDTEEERRIFHVALTRAVERSLVLADDSRPSRFLMELEGTAPKPRAVSPQEAEQAPTVGEGDVVKVSGGYVGTVVSVTPEAVEVKLDRGAQLSVHPAEIKDVVERVSEPADESLVEALKAWRLEVAQERKVPAYVVMHDSTLTAIAAHQPITEEDLLGIPGIGARKLEDYGDDIIAIVTEMTSS